MVWVQDPLDREIAPEEMAQLEPGLRERALCYCYRNRAGRFVLSWDHNRYVNHSFSPTCIMTPYGLELAVRDIHPGEEMTNDYGTLNIIEPFEPVDEGHARKSVQPDDLARHHPEWDRRLQEACAAIAAVEQPLRPLISGDIWQTCLRMADGKEPMRSIRDCLFSD